MALKDTRGGREFDKFVADGSGDASIRVTTTSSVTTSASNSGATVDDTSAAAASVVLTAQNVEGKERIGIQIFNKGSGSTRNSTFKVYGSLVAEPNVSIPTSDWTQIGDDISVDASSSAYKAISTTPVKFIGITGQTVHASDTSTCDVYIMAD